MSGIMEHIEEAAVLGTVRDYSRRLPIAKIAAKVMAGAKLRYLGVTREVEVRHYSVKESVFPFTASPGWTPRPGRR